MGCVATFCTTVGSTGTEINGGVTSLTSTSSHRAWESAGRCCKILHRVTTPTNRPRIVARPAFHSNVKARVGIVGHRNLFDAFDDSANRFAVFATQLDAVHQREDHGSQRPLKMALRKLLQFLPDVCFSADIRRKAMSEAALIAYDIAFGFQTVEQTLYGSMQ